MSDDQTADDPPADIRETKRTPHDYLKYVFRSSERRHLLVEGSSDRDLFRRLFERIDPDYGRRVLIDTSDRIAWVPELGAHYGARDKVDLVCAPARGRPESERLVGLVDREYHDFRFDPEIRDDHPSDRVDGRLVRTRGHSVENYLFDFATFAERMREYVPDNVTATVALFERVFPDAVRVACTVGLACRHHPSGRQHSQAVEKGTVGWQVVRISPTAGLELDADGWRTELARRDKLPPGWADEAVDEYHRWQGCVAAADFSIVRWLCHGHIGVSVIWAAVARCVYETAAGYTSDERFKLADQVRRGPHEQRLRACIDRWVDRALGGTTDCPHVVLDMLDLSPTPTTARFAVPDHP